MPDCKQENRNEQRKRNYARGCWDNDRHDKPFNSFESLLIRLHIIKDRMLARLLKRSVQGIQVKRCRIKCYTVKNAIRK